MPVVMTLACEGQRLGVTRTTVMCDAEGARFPNMWARRRTFMADLP